VKAFSLSALCLLLIPLPALAGPNAGGTLLVHNTGLVYGGGNDTTNTY